MLISTQTRENVMNNVRNMAVSAFQALRSEVLPQWEDRALELRHDAVALRDALVIRFSKDPKVIYDLTSHYNDWAVDAHLSEPEEDGTRRVYRRATWVDKAHTQRLEVLAERWKLPPISIGLLPDPVFTTPTDSEDLPPEYVDELGIDALPWKKFDHKAYEQKYLDNRAAQTATIVRCAKSGAVGLGSFVGVGGVITGLVAMVYLGGWLGSIGALYALGFILEVVV